MRFQSSLLVRFLFGSLLALIPGYFFLLLFHHKIYDAERLESHEHLVARLGEGLRDGTLALPLPTGLGIEAALSSSHELSPPRQDTGNDGSIWLTSRTLQTSEGGQSVVLVVRQRVDASEEHFQNDFLLIILVALISIPITVFLLYRLILINVVKPLSRIAGEMNDLQIDLFGYRLLGPHKYPVEFSSILASFNELQVRVNKALQRERYFVDSVAHELRTPTTLIFSHAQRLEAEVSQSSSASVALIAAEAQRMGELISVMLDFARVDGGRLMLHVVDVDPEFLLLDAFERLQASAPERLKLMPSIDENLPRIQVDSDRLHQCLAALVDNALRYSEGSVEMGISASSDKVTLYVRDHGPGISLAERDQVLERFVRGSTSRGTKGSGMGLAIVKNLMLVMKAELLIGQAPGGGADVQLVFKVLSGSPLK